MSEETTPTRQDTVEANIASVEGQYGADQYLRIITKCVKDMSVSLAMLVDAGTTTTTQEET